MASQIEEVSGSSPDGDTHRAAADGNAHGHTPGPSFTASGDVIISRSGAHYSPSAARKLAAVMVEGAINASPSMAGGYLSELAEMVDALRLLDGRPKVVPLGGFATTDEIIRADAPKSSEEARNATAKSAADALIDLLGDALVKASVAINAQYALAQAEYQGLDHTATKHDRTVREGRTAIREALAAIVKAAGSEPVPDFEPLRLSGLTYKQALKQMRETGCAVSRPHWCEPVLVLQGDLPWLDHSDELEPWLATAEDEAANDWQMVIGGPAQ